METSIIILSTLALLQFITNMKLVSKIRKMKVDNLNLEKEKQQIDQIFPGDKVTFEVRLTWNGDKKFTILYEANVIEVSDKSVKVDPYDFSEIVKMPSDLRSDKNHRTIILNFMKDNWVDRDEISIMMRPEYIRDKKINEVLK